MSTFSSPAHWCLAVWCYRRRCKRAQILTRVMAAGLSQATRWATSTPHLASTPSALFLPAIETRPVGTGALFSNVEGVENTAIGVSALFGNTTGDNNTAIGRSALAGNTTGSNNTGMSNIALGSFAEPLLPRPITLLVSASESRVRT